jgi:hypothetical protein
MCRVAAFVVLSVLILGLVGGPGGPAPSAAAPLGKGAVEIGPSLAYSHSSYSFSGSSDFSTTTVDVNGFVGYFVTDMVEVGGSLLVTYLSIDAGPSANASSTDAGLTGGITLNFVSSGNVVPFVRGSLGFTSHSGEASFGSQSTLIAPLLEGGLRAMVGRSASVNFTVGYQHHSDALGVPDESANIVTFGVGVSLFPKTGT